jgi:hypothetical protein
MAGFASGEYRRPFIESIQSGPTERFPKSWLYKLGVEF